MQFISTRTGDASIGAAEAILRGLAPDGGLYVPECLPRLSLEDIDALRPLTYAQRARRVLGALLDGLPRRELGEAIDAAYASFDDPRVAPLAPLSDGVYALELFHGPTLAFKDVALQLLPRLMVLSMRERGETREALILAATSGDTGKAALEGFADVPGTRCAVFYPRAGVSEAQRLQMVTQRGGNTHVIAVEGNFDDAQTGVKRIFADAEFGRRLSQRGIVLSSANSINFGRLAPQVVYYFSAYADLLESGAIRAGEEVNFCVPTGNFGNILAGWYARCCGLPAGRLICASNRNHVLSDFLASGRYEVADRPFYRTASPSMDILISSNLERLLFELCGRDAARVRDWMASLAADGHYDVGAQALDALGRTFAGGFADDAQTLQEIGRVFARDGYLMDTHTAVASRVLADYRARTGDARTTVLVSTASPYKFGRAVLGAIAGERAAEGLDDFACCDALARATGTRVPESIAQLPRLPVRHTQVCQKDDMEAALLRVLP